MTSNVSSKVMQLRFMQRAIEKKQQIEATKEVPEQANEVTTYHFKLSSCHQALKVCWLLLFYFIQEHWVAKGTGEKGCVVLLEGDPPATSGRMSFQNFKTGPKTAYQGTASDVPNGEQDQATVDDEAMAARFVNSYFNGAVVPKDTSKKKYYIHYFS